MDSVSPFRRGGRGWNKNVVIERYRSLFELLELYQRWFYLTELQLCWHTCGRKCGVNVLGEKRLLENHNPACEYYGNYNKHEGRHQPPIPLVGNSCKPT